MSFKGERIERPRTHICKTNSPKSRKIRTVPFQHEPIIVARVMSERDGDPHFTATSIARHKKFPVRPRIARNEHTQALNRRLKNGQVTSAGEGPMEEVVVSAKKDGSTIRISVVTNDRSKRKSVLNGLPMRCILVISSRSLRT